MTGSRIHLPQETVGTCGTWRSRRPGSLRQPGRWLGANDPHPLPALAGNGLDPGEAPLL